MTTNTWFSVDKEGLAKLLERKGKEFILYELIQNCWDTDAKVVTVTLQPSDDLRGYADLEVIDDHPEGWKDLTHAWTLYAESEKKGDAQKRGRFNLGEKLVLALCKSARIETTTGGVAFDEDGRHTLRTKRAAGSRFYAKVKMTLVEQAAASEAVMKLLAPEGVATSFNSQPILARLPLRRIEATLPTEVADSEGILRRSSRKTVVEVYEPREGEIPSVYEMGIPVVETGDKYHYNVTQKVPLNSDRDNVTPAYLRELRTLVLNAMFTEVKKEEATAPWVRDAAEDEDVSQEAMTHVITERFGEKRVISDPNDQEGTKMAVSQGYTVIHPGSLSKEEWSNVRRYTVALPAGQVTPSPKPYSPEGAIQKELPRSEWSDGIRNVAGYMEWVGREVLGNFVTVRIVKDPAWPFKATFGRSAVLTLNLGALGQAWFEAPYWAAVDELLVHELGHWYSSDHLSHEFHDALCKVAAAMVNLALSEPEAMKKWREGV